MERIRERWHLFATGRAGLRFRERYRLHQSRRNRRGPFDVVRLFYIVGGIVLVLVSALFGWLPVLGWGTAILGFAMIAGEFYPVARLMDRLESEARIIFRPLGKKLATLPAWAQLSVSLGIALATFTLVYGLYSMTFGT